ncbi:MAG: IPT/TIG domain-containing protein [Myxococcales bacterium]|nr:IPT/TIG domain-containing protein [Myxococcales bacterium]
MMKSTQFASCLGIAFGLLGLVLLPTCGSNGSGPQMSMDPTCSDGKLNGNETDVDCGGRSCAACPINKACWVAADCQSAVCTANTCGPPPPCFNQLQDGSETDVDCGGGSCSPCALTKACMQDSDCQSAACDAKVCITPPAITRVSPDTGGLAGGTVTTLTGSGFVTGSAVTVGGAPCASPALVSATQLTCTVAKATEVGPVDIVVTNPNQRRATLARSFTYSYASLSFAPKVDLALGTKSVGLKMADLNGDKKLDLVASCTVASSGILAAWLGNGDGAFQPRTTYFTGGDNAGWFDLGDGSRKFSAPSRNLNRSGVSLARKTVRASTSVASWEPYRSAGETASLVAPVGDQERV